MKSELESLTLEYKTKNYLHMELIKDLLALISRKNPDEIKCKCGHHSKLAKEMHIHGKTSHLEINYRPFRRPPYCLDCVEKVAIICPWCGEPIFIGEYVTLYTPNNPNFKIPEGAVIYSKEPLQLVGCQRSNCAQSGADYCGIWEAPGVVRRIPSAIERIMAGEKYVISNF